MKTTASSATGEAASRRDLQLCPSAGYLPCVSVTRKVDPPVGTRAATTVFSHTRCLDRLVFSSRCADYVPKYENVISCMEANVALGEVKVEQATLRV